MPEPPPAHRREMRDVLLRSSLPSARYRSPNSAPSSRTEIERQRVSHETLVCVSSAGSAPRGPLAACLVSRRPPRPSTPSLLHRTASRHPQRPSPTASWLQHPTVATPRHHVTTALPVATPHHHVATALPAAALPRRSPQLQDLPRSQPQNPSCPRRPPPRCPAARTGPAALSSRALRALRPTLPRRPHAPSAPPARARHPRRRRGPPRATSRRPHRDPPPTPMPVRRARTRHSRRQRHALHVRTLTPYLAAASLPSARPHARRPPPAFGSNSRVFHVKHSFASHPHRTPNVL